MKKVSLITLLLLIMASLLAIINKVEVEAATRASSIKVNYQVGIGYNNDATKSTNPVIRNEKVTTQNTYTTNVIVLAQNGNQLDFKADKIPYTYNGTERLYDQVLTGWKLISVVKEGELITEFIEPEHQNYANPYDVNKDIGTVYAQNGFYNVPYGVTEITVEAVYGRAIYVRSPFDKMYYDLDLRFQYGENVESGQKVTSSHAPDAVKTAVVATPRSSDDNFGTSVADAVSTLNRAYSLMDNSSSNTVYSTVMLLCGDQYEISYKSATGIPSTAVAGTYEKYTFGALGYLSSSTTNKPATIASMDYTKKYTLHVISNSGYNLPLYSSARFDNVILSELNANDHFYDLRINANTSFPVRNRRFSVNTAQTSLEITETVVSSSSTQFIWSAKASKVILNGGRWILYTQWTDKAYTAQSNLYYKVGGYAHITTLGNANGQDVTPLYNEEIDRAFYNCATVNIVGGQVDNLYGTPNQETLPIAGDVHIYVGSGRVSNLYGGNKGSLLKNDTTNEKGNINIKTYGGTIGTIYGAGQFYTSVIENNVYISLDNTIVTGNVYGGGKGGKVKGDVFITITNSRIDGSVYGAGLGLTDNVTDMVIWGSAPDSTSINDAIKNFNSKVDTENAKITNGLKYQYWNEASLYFPIYDVESQQVINRIYHSYSKQENKFNLFLRKSKASLSLSEVSGDISLDIDSSTITGSVYGGGSISAVNGGINLRVSNSTIKQNLYGGGDGATVPNKVKLYSPLDQDTYVTADKKSNKTDSEKLLGEFTWSDDSNILNYFDGIYDGKNQNVYKSDGTIITFDQLLASLQDADKTNAKAVMDKYGSSLYLYTKDINKLGKVDGSISLTSTNNTVSGNTFGGGNAGEVLGDISVNIIGGSYQDLYGGSNQANIYGSVELNIASGTMKSVYGGNNASGSIDGTLTVTTTGGNITSLYGGGNKAAYDGSIIVNIMENPTPTNPYKIGSLYGGANQANVGGNILLTIDDGIITNAFGGNNASGIISGTINVIVNNGTITNLYGGGNKADYILDSSIAIVTINNGNITNSYGGGKAAQVKTAATQISGGTIQTVYGGGEGQTATTQNAGVRLNSGTVTNVYGGGNAGQTNTVGVELIGGTVVNNVYGGGYQGPTGVATVIAQGSSIGSNLYGGGNAGVTNTTNVTVNSGTITGTVYGGGEGKTATTTKATVTINNDVVTVYGGGNAGSTTTAITNIKAGTVTGTIYGGGKGTDAHTESVQLSINTTGTVNDVYGGGNAGSTTTTNITINSGTIYGTIYGGGQIAETTNTNVLINSSVNDVYGGGYQGPSTTTNVTLNNATANGTIYGGGYAGDTTTANVTINSGVVIESIYGGGNEGYTANANITVTSGEVDGNLFGGGYQGETGQVSIDITSSTFNSNIYGGGYNGYTAEVTINYDNDIAMTNDISGGGLNGATGTAILNVNSGSITGTIYGGGEGATAITDVATVNINGGTVNNVFGGGDAGNSGTTTVEVNSGNITGTIYGGGNIANVDDTNIKINSNVKDIYGGGYQGETKTTNVVLDGATVNGTIFGGGYAGRTTESNVSVKTGQVTKNIYGGGYQGQTDTTHINVNSGTISGLIYGGGEGETAITEQTEIIISGGDVKTIYGGGNKGATGISKVVVNSGNIDGNIYGGGYAGTTDQTSVILEETTSSITVNGSVFGGGEGETATVYTSTSVEIDLKTSFEVTETPTSTETITSGEIKTEVTNNSVSYIKGNVYGGGDLGQVGVGIINTASNTADISKAAQINVTVYDGYIQGSVFGGGNGVPGVGINYNVKMGTVFGQTTTNIFNGYIKGNIYGGGTQSRLYSEKGQVAATVNIIQEKTDDKIVIAGSVFGGGDRGNTVNVSVPTTVGDVTVNIQNENTDSPAQIYFINGGVYGDGNLCLVRGTRTVNITNLTLNDSKKLKTFYSLQRADIVNLDNTDIVLLGAIDLVEEGDNAVYSINRINQLNMFGGSTIKLDQIVKYLSELTSDVEMDRNFVNQYLNDLAPLTKSEIENYIASSNDKNTVCVANGLYLDIRKIDNEYGNVSGLFTLQLLFANAGEGGGFVYADHLTSIGDFICETKFSTGSEEYMPVVDKEINSDFYYWYIQGANINYTIVIESFIGASEEEYSYEVLIPETGTDQIYYTLEALQYDNLLELISGSTKKYELVQKSSGLIGQEIAIQIFLGPDSLGFIYYDNFDPLNPLKIQLSDSLNTVAPHGVTTDYSLIQSGLLLSTNQSLDTIKIVFHKSIDVDTESKFSINATIRVYQLDALNSTFTDYTGTNKISLNMMFMITRLVPIGNVFYEPSKSYLGPSSTQEIFITGNSSFTVEYQTRYIPGAFPYENALSTITWSLTAKGYKYYFDSKNGTYFTTDYFGNVIYISSNIEFVNGEDDKDKFNVLYDSTESKYYYLEADSQKVWFTTYEDEYNGTFYKGLKITLLDLTIAEEPTYFYYVCDGTENTISILAFMQMGTSITIQDLIDSNSKLPAFISIYQERGLTRITERLIFIFDFAETDWQNNHITINGNFTLHHIYQTKDILDYVNNKEEYDIATDQMIITRERSYPKSAPFEIGVGAPGIGDFDASFVENEYYEDETAHLEVVLSDVSQYTNTQFVEGEIGIRITMPNNQRFPAGIMFLYNNTYYPAYGNKYVVIPIRTYGTHIIAIENLLGSISETINTSEQNGKYSVLFDINLCNLPDDRYLGTAVEDVKDEVTNESFFDIETSTAYIIDKVDYALNIIMSARVLEHSENVTITIDALKNNVEPQNDNLQISLNYLLESDEANGASVEVNLSDVFTNVAELTIGSNRLIVNENASHGIYKLIISYGDKTEQITFIVK